LKWIKLEGGAAVKKKEESKKLLVGTKVLVYWNKKPDQGWYAGTILELSAKKLTVAKQAILHSPQELAKAAQSKRRSEDRADEANLAEGERRTMESLVSKKPRVEGPSNQQVLAEIAKLSFSFLISRKEILEKTPQNQNTIVNGVSFTPLSRKFPDITVPTAVFVLASNEKVMGHGLKIILPHIFEEEELLYGLDRLHADKLAALIDFASSVNFNCLMSSEGKRLSLTQSVKKFMVQKCSNVKKDYQARAHLAEAHQAVPAPQDPQAAQDD